MGDTKDAILEQIRLIGPYGYVPNAAGAFVFTMVFALECLALMYASIRGRAWWLLGTVGVGAAFECAGHTIRIYSHWHPGFDDPYIAQQVLLVITPVLFVAAHFTILSRLVSIHMPHLISPIKPKYIIIVFVSIDILSLVIQAAGSGLAATSMEDFDAVSTINGKGDIVVAGLAIQLVGYIFFNILFITFWWKLEPGKVDRRFLIAVYSSAILVFTRSTFRTVEMSVGWVGKIAVTEWCFLTFDATMISLAVIILILVSPTKYLPRQPASTSSDTLITSSEMKIAVA
ncbi:hypothetical protein CBS101457_003064 [Exobasidium rhododendri]|nr:hypothetical protein CBS101457_003064 [Exobasidium rhododendri]